MQQSDKLKDSSRRTNWKVKKNIYGNYKTVRHINIQFLYVLRMRAQKI